MPGKPHICEIGRKEKKTVSFLHFNIQDKMKTAIYSTQREDSSHTMPLLRLLSVNSTNFSLSSFILDYSLKCHPILLWPSKGSSSPNHASLDALYLWTPILTEGLIFSSLANHQSVSLKFSTNKYNCKARVSEPTLLQWWYSIQIMS